MWQPYGASSSPADSFSAVQIEDIHGNREQSGPFVQREQRQTRWITPNVGRSQPGSGERMQTIPNLQPPRPLRFVPHDCQPRTKRRRISAACQTCRKRKTRCSGERPSCDTCLQTGQTCLGYSESGQQERDPGSLNPTLKTETTPRRPGHEQYSSSPEHPGHIQTSEQRDRMSDHSSHTAATSTSGGRTSDASLSQLSQASDPSYAFLSSEHFFAPHGPTDGGTDLDTKSTPRIVGSGDEFSPFRFFDPSAFFAVSEQMVPHVDDISRGLDPRSSSTVTSPAAVLSSQPDTSGSTFGNIVAPFHDESDIRRPVSVPEYDPNDPRPTNPLLTLLIETFFTHLGHHFPFLQCKRFMRDVQTKQANPILVNAVCALSARSSNHSLLDMPQGESLGAERDTSVPISKHGHVFTQRAISALPTAFSHPNLAVVQACLLLAYGQFAHNNDSGLWMYLGLSIRMAQELGMGRSAHAQRGSRETSRPSTGARESSKQASGANRARRDRRPSGVDPLVAGVEERKAAEQERIDTFWALFFLDRVVSAIRDRPPTLRDEDLDLPLPSKQVLELKTGWPAPFLF